MAISPVDPQFGVMANILPVLPVGLLVATHRHFPLSHLSYALVTRFLTLPTIGVHYTYAQVPLGFWMQDAFELDRNHFDRLAHFSFGLLMAYPVREIVVRAAGVRGFWSYSLPVSGILAMSGFFEIVETWVAQIVSPELGDAYLGTQGDIWDAQKDMTMAFCGVLLAMLLTSAFRKRVSRIGSNPLQDDA